MSTNEDKYISLEQFAVMAGRSVSTIKRRREDIPGVELADSRWRVLKGTRFPLKISSYKINSDSDRRRALLRAISTYRYVSADMLGVYQETFNGYLRDFLQADLIRENDLPNHYGANHYDCTPSGSELANCDSNSISKAIANTVGTFTGAVISEVLGNP